MKVTVGKRLCGELKGSKNLLLNKQRLQDTLPPSTASCWLQEQPNNEVPNNISLLAVQLNMFLNIQQINLEVLSIIWLYVRDK